MGMGEVERAEHALDGIDVHILSAPVTLKRLLSELREKDVDLLYLVAHGQIVDGKPHILLQGDTLEGIWIEGEDLNQWLKRQTTLCTWEQFWRLTAPLRPAPHRPPAAHPHTPPATG